MSYVVADGPCYANHIAMMKTVILICTHAKVNRKSGT